jgi:hypothetical protein
MTGQLSQRLATLEKAQDDQGGIRVVIAEPGETAAQAREREGVEDGVEVLVVVFV